MNAFSFEQVAQAAGYNIAGQIADELGAIRAALADLKKREDDARAKLLELGINSAEGQLFRVTVSHADRERVDWAAVAEKLQPSRQLITAHTIRAEVITIRTNSKTGGR